MAEKKEMQEPQLEYIKRVKNVLNTVYGQSRLSLTQLQVLIEERYGFVVNRGTLGKLFDVNDPNINYACLITVCDFFNFDFNDFLKPESLYEPDVSYGNGTQVIEKMKKKEEKEPVHPFLESLSDVKKKFTMLEDEGYMGEFHGFIMSPAKSSNSIGEFRLNLWKDEDGVSHAKFVRKALNKQKKERFEYTGVPYYSKAYKTVLMFLTDKTKGEFYFLSFGFQQYRTEEGLLFRQGLAVTGESLGMSSLVAQNFVLTGTDIANDKEKKKYIHGLLKAPNNEFCIPVETVQKLADEYPVVQQLLKELPGTLDQEKESVYIMNEDNILSVGRVKMSKYDRIKALLILKGESLVADKYYYHADSKFSGFGKNILNGIDSEPDEEE